MSNVLMFIVFFAFNIGLLFAFIWFVLKLKKRMDNKKNRQEGFSEVAK